MNLLEMNDAILYGKKKKTIVPVVTADDLTLFKKTIAMSARIKSMYEQTDDANSFFAIFPGVKQIVGAKKCVECFYACKLGYIMHGIPAKLVYVLTKMFNENGKQFVNKAMSTALPLLKPYVNCAFEYNEESYDLKDVIENICGQSVKLLNTSVRKVKSGSAWEVFIPVANRVAILPDGMADMLSQDDCERLSFDTNKGIVLNDIPVRTLGNRLGITRDDFDLRECV